MHCIYKDNLVPYPMPGTTLPGRGGISGSRQQLDLRYTSTPNLGVEVYRAEAWISNPDSGVADLIGYLGVVCGDQKYSHTIPEPVRYEHSLLLSGTPRYRSRTAPKSPESGC